MRSKIQIKHELAGLLGLSILLILSIYLWPTSALRTVLGLFYILLFPGYTLAAALFPSNDALKNIDRVALSFGLSIAVVPLIVLPLDYTPWGIRLKPILVSVTSFILLCSGVAYYRRSRLPVEERFAICFELDMSRWQRVGRLDAFLFVILAFSIVAAIGALVYTIAEPKAGEKFTEFYILGPDGAAEGYPEEIVVGEPILLIIGVVNHEHSDVQYRVERGESRSSEQIASLQLSQGETWEQPYTFALTKPGEDQKVTFLLYKGDDEEPYRSLHLWITVKEKPSAQ